MLPVIDSERIRREVIIGLELFLRQQERKGVAVGIEQFMGMYCGTLETEKSYMSSTKHVPSIGSYPEK